MTELDQTGTRRLAELLLQVRALPADARGFALFELRDELARLGVDRNDLDGFDPADDEALDREIDAVGRLADGDNAISVHAERPPLAGLVGGLRNLTQKLQQPAIDGLQQMRIDNWSLSRGRPPSFDKLPSTYDYDALNRRFAKTTEEGDRLGKEIFHAIRQNPTHGMVMTDRKVGGKGGVEGVAMNAPTVLGGHHNHPSQDLDWKTGEPRVGGSISGGDAAGLIKSGALYSIAQDGDDQTMFVRTDRTPVLNSQQQKALAAEQEKRAQDHYLGGMSWRDATFRSAKETAERYGLGFYAGRGGVFKRVPKDT